QLGDERVSPLPPMLLQRPIAPQRVEPSAERLERSAAAAPLAGPERLAPARLHRPEAEQQLASAERRAGRLDPLRQLRRGALRLLLLQQERPVAPRPGDRLLQLAPRLAQLARELADPPAAGLELLLPPRLQLADDPAHRAPRPLEA